MDFWEFVASPSHVFSSSSSTAEFTVYFPTQPQCPAHTFLYTSYLMKRHHPMPVSREHKIMKEDLSIQLVAPTTAHGTQLGFLHIYIKQRKGNPVSEQGSQQKTFTTVVLILSEISFTSICSVPPISKWAPKVSRT